MKIRMAIMLLAGSFFGLPITAPRPSSAQGIDPQLRVSYYEQWTESHVFRLCYYPNPYMPTLTEEYSYWNLWYDPWDNGTFLTTETWNDCPPPMQHRDESWSQTSWPCCANQNDIGWKTWWHWSGGAYDEGYDPVAPFSPPWGAWGKCDSTNITHRTNGVFQWDDITTDRYETRIELLTGGETNSTREALFWMWVSATGGSGQIPPGQLFALGKTAKPDGETYGDIYKKLSDNQRVDATVTAPGNCYAFTADVGKGWLVLRRNGFEDITDKTNVVWVGEKIDLECVLSPEIATITNYQWTVPGQKIKDWVLSGPAPNYTNATVAPLTNLAIPAITFYWVKDEAQAVVQCTAQVEGETLTAKTRFEVRRPDATWTLTPKFGNVVVTNTVCYATLPAYYYLTTGLDCVGSPTWSDCGMFFEFNNVDVKGHPGPWEVSWLQIGDIDWKWNKSPPPLGPLTYKSYGKLTKGLDGSFPYKNFTNHYGQATYGIDWDTPQVALFKEDTYHWRIDRFEAYLMWQSKRMPSIPVPLKVGNWNWAGKAERMDTNTPPMWRLVLPKTVPVIALGVNVYSPPEWTNRIQSVGLFYNDFYYPTP